MLSVSQKLHRQQYLSKLPSGTSVTEEIKRITQSKTHQQVKTIFGLAMATIKQEFDDRGWGTDMLLNLPEPTGIGVSVNLLKEYFYAVCPIYNEEGQRISLSHKDCSTIVASGFFDEIRNWSASQWSIYIPEPDPDWNKEKL
jgi:hypothetical protein